MEWFKRKPAPPPTERKEIPDGLWTKCNSCGEIIYVRELEKDLWVCRKCSYHFRIRSTDYIDIMLDKDSFVELDTELVSLDPLQFKDSKRYPDRIAEARKKTGRNDAVISGIGKIDGREISFAVMDFAFVGGSMGSVVGEKIARTIERALNRQIPLVIVSCSGGARMQEGILSLLQMAKTSGLLARLSETKTPFISILTNPTTAGVMASYASLGDAIIAEPGALLGFAGRRVIEQTIGQKLPENFQTSEFFRDHGFLDKIVHRHELRHTVSLLIDYFTP
ncbi:MAG: acetyl-CoA carboxylase carboxyltransferase subunit beta [candidate division Zixibacteria bacterium]|nr:acetyl-CoA carboxylase carboxyltransferase subunit beta [candidate division Zixibacteria bacterium]